MGFFDFLKKTEKAGEPAVEAVEPVSVYESKDEVIVSAKLPGVSKEEISLHITPANITLKVARKAGKEHEEQAAGAYSYSAQSEFKSFSETVAFPAQVQPRAAKASFKNGVLEIRIPKHRVQPKGTFIHVR